MALLIWCYHGHKISKQTGKLPVVRTLYSLAQAELKDTAKFASLVADVGYFYEVAGGKKYYGGDIDVAVDVYVSRGSDISLELYDPTLSSILSCRAGAQRHRRD